MTRIISGYYRGHRLRTLKGELTRPTSERTREALFSAIQSRIGTFAGTRFLDLFAGSGAVGLEAASRGAVVTLVEQDRRAGRVIRQNISQLGVDVALHQSSAQRFLKQHVPETGFDVVFMDPPYADAAALLAEVLPLLTPQTWLSSAAVVVVEMSRREKPPGWPRWLVQVNERTYGQSKLYYLGLTKLSN